MVLLSGRNLDLATLAACGAKEHVVPGSAITIRPRGCRFQLCRYRGKPDFRRSSLRPNTRYRSTCGLFAFHVRRKANGGTACSNTAASNSNSGFFICCCATTGGPSASRRCSPWNCRSNSWCLQRCGRSCRFSAMRCRRCRGRVSCSSARPVPTKARSVSRRTSTARMRSIAFSRPPKMKRASATRRW